MSNSKSAKTFKTTNTTIYIVYVDSVLGTFGHTTIDRYIVTGGQPPYTFSVVYTGQFGAGYPTNYSASPTAYAPPATGTYIQVLYSDSATGTSTSVVTVTDNVGTIKTLIGDVTTN